MIADYELVVNELHKKTLQNLNSRFGLRMVVFKFNFSYIKHNIGFK